VTVSLITTSIVIVCPATYLPSAVVERTAVTVGAVVSTTIAFEPPSESPLDVAGKVFDELFPAISVMVPELRESAVELK
jgi:hypothetical protein